MHVFFASSDARLCLGSHDTYVEDVASSVKLYMLRAHEKLIILGAFVRSVRVSAPLQSSQVFFFLQKFFITIFCMLFYLKYVFYHPLTMSLC